MNISTLFDNFRTTREYRKLKPNSQLMYEQMMRRAVKTFDIANRVSQVTTKTVDTLYESMPKTSSTNMFMKVMRRIWNIGIRNKWASENPFEKMGLEAIPAREVIWTKEQVSTYYAQAWHYGYKDLAIVVRLCYELGQRPGDMMKLTRDSFNKEFTEVKFIQEKTGKRMHLPVQPDTSRYLRALFSDHDRFKLNTKSVKDLNTQHHAILTLLSLPSNLQLRDLRRTALVEAMESGATDAEGQALSGHSDRDMLNTYAPRSFAMAKAAMDKRVSSSRPNFQNMPGSLADTLDKLHEAGIISLTKGRG